MNVAEQKVLQIFNKVRTSCKAYQMFLNSQTSNHIQASSFIEFQKIPVTNKKNYIEKYPIEERLYKGKTLNDYYMICTSSGSTGEPTLWPRDYESDKKLELLKKTVLQNLFDIQNKSTLIVNTFGLGAWTAGMLESKLSWAASVGNKLSVVTPGLDKVVALRIIKSLSKYYDQTIITGYPPFIIDLLEYGLQNKFSFKKINTKIYYTSERITEDKRDNIVKIISNNSSRYDVVGFYACSESGVLGTETKDTIDILNSANKNNNFCKALFTDTNPPSLIEYNPEVKFLEEYKGRILITANQPVPLVRYDIFDRGGLLMGTDIVKACNKFNIKYSRNINGKYYAYLYGRYDAVRLLCNIYIDDIKQCLEKSRLSNKFTGNFKYGLEKKTLKNRLKLIVYLKENEKVTFAEKELFISEMFKNLTNINPDFRMIQSGIKIEKFNIQFIPDTSDRYKKGKFHYFL